MNKDQIPFCHIRKGMLKSQSDNCDEVYWLYMWGMYNPLTSSGDAPVEISTQSTISVMTANNQRSSIFLVWTGTWPMVGRYRLLVASQSMIGCDFSQMRQQLASLGDDNNINYYCWPIWSPIILSQVVLSQYWLFHFFFSHLHSTN